MYKVKFYKGKDHFEDAYSIREKVFIEEQGFQNEEDERDQTCIHLVLYDQDKPIACGRMYSEKDDQLTLGRIAVLPEYRKNKLGIKVMEELEFKGVIMGYNSFVLSAQVQAQGFYAQCGYEAVGEVYMDEHCPHITMCKNFNELAAARLQINAIDKELAHLFEKRMQAVKQVVQYKHQHQLAIFDASREEEVLVRNTALINDENLKKYYKKYCLMQMDISKEYQEEILKNLD